MVFAPTGGPLVVLAHESERLATRIGVALAETGLQPLHARQGATAVRLIESKRPAAAVLDVGLPEIMSFQIIERMRGRPELEDVKVVLVASVYNKTAYKRRPTSLYGADDYVEQHHVHDLLPRKLCALLGLPEPTRQAVLARVDGADTRADLGPSARVRALARSIAADVVLYHGEELAAVRAGHPSVKLDRALEEGRLLLAELAVGADVTGDPVRDAFDTLLRGLPGAHA